MTDIPIRNLATDLVSVDRVAQLIKDRNELHGKLVIAHWALERMVRDNEREVKELNATIASQAQAIAEQQRKIDGLLALMGVKRTDNADGLPAWHQPNPLPRGMR
jgi:uncharacterized coiled-coil protein SlyX